MLPLSPTDPLLPPPPTDPLLPPPPTDPLLPPPPTDPLLPPPPTDPLLPPPPTQSPPPTDIDDGFDMFESPTIKIESSTIKDGDTTNKSLYYLHLLLVVA